MIPGSRVEEWPGNHMDELGTIVSSWPGSVLVVAGVSYERGITTARLEPATAAQVEQARRLKELS